MPTVKKCNPEPLRESTMNVIAAKRHLSDNRAFRCVIFILMQDLGRGESTTASKGPQQEFGTPDEYVASVRILFAAGSFTSFQQTMKNTPSGGSAVRCAFRCRTFGGIEASLFFKRITEFELVG